MAKYSKGAQKSVESAMKRMEKGTLRSGNSEKKVTNPKQAIAIGLSEARAKGAKVPVKKTAVKKAATKKKVVTKKAPVKKAAVKKVAVKKKVPAKKAIVKKAVVKKTPAKKTIVKKTSDKKGAPVKKEATPVSQQAESTVSTFNIPNDGRNDLPIPAVEDPITAVDKKLMAKATAKIDPNHQLRLSSRKGLIRSSGKKPLWH